MCNMGDNYHHYFSTAPDGFYHACRLLLNLRHEDYSLGVASREHFRSNLLLQTFTRIWKNHGLYVIFILFCRVMINALILVFSPSLLFQVKIIYVNFWAYFCLLLFSDIPLDGGMWSRITLGQLCI